MAIALRGVSARYATGNIILDDINLNLDGRNIILGPNGSGKTTLFRTVLGLNVSSKGRIIIDETDVKEVNGTPGLVATNLDEVYNLLRVPVEDVARLYLELCKGDFSRFLDRIREFELSNVLNKRLDELSAGQKRLVCNFIALSMGAKYVLLDEPFENLDPARRARMAKIIMSRADNIIMNTHATWLLDKFSDWQTYLMFDGRVYGPIVVEKLLNSSIVEGQSTKSFIYFSIRDRFFSLTPGDQGIRLTSIESLDRLFEVGL